MAGRQHTIGGKPRSVSAAVEAAAERSEKSSRLVSISEFERLTGFDRGTVRNWIKKHRCPTDSGGGKGEAIVLDIRAVWKWREEFVRAEEAAKYARSAPDAIDDDSMSPSDRYKLEQIRLTRLKIGQQAELLLPRDFIEYSSERMFGILRQAAMAIPDRIFRDMAGYPTAAKEKWYRGAQAHVIALLKEAATAVAIALPHMDERLRSGLPALSELPEFDASKFEDDEE